MRLHVYSFIDVSPSIEDVNDEENRVQSVWEFSVLASQLFCESKIDLNK